MRDLTVTFTKAELDEMPWHELGLYPDELRKIAYRRIESLLVFSEQVVGLTRVDDIKDGSIKFIFAIDYPEGSLMRAIVKLNDRLWDFELAVWHRFIESLKWLALLPMGIILWIMQGIDRWLEKQNTARAKAHYLQSLKSGERWGKDTATHIAIEWGLDPEKFIAYLREDGLYE